MSKKVYIFLADGIENADILIAVTGSDEMNLLCCLIAQKTGHCQTIYPHSIFQRTQVQLQLCTL